MVGDGISDTVIRYCIVKRLNRTQQSTIELELVQLNFAGSWATLIGDRAIFRFT